MVMEVMNLPMPRGHDKVFQTSGAESQSPGDQMEGVAGARTTADDANSQYSLFPLLFTIMVTPMAITEVR